MSKIAVVLLILWQLLIPAHNLVYHVDSVNGNDYNSGLSEANAWRTISKVNSMVFTAGDKILLKRNSIWYETLNLKGNGSYGNPILISDYGEGYLPVIDGENIRTQCIVLERKSYVTVSNIYMRNATRQGAIRIKRCDNIIVENCTFYVTGHGGVFVESSRDCIIRDNRMTTPNTLHNNQTDGIYSQHNNGIIFDNNHIVISNRHPDQHCDGIQSFRDANIIAKNNYVEQDNFKTSNAQGIYATTMTGDHIYYNNVVYCPNTRAGVMSFRNLKEGRGSLKAYHNTLVGGGTNILAVTENAGVDAKNNIFYSTSTSSILNLDTENIYLDNNLYFHKGSGNVIGYGKGKSSKKIAALKVEGREMNGIYADPMLTRDFQLMPGSPAIDKGLLLGAPYDLDKRGVKRPQGSEPDIGAYEYP